VGWELLERGKKDSQDEREQKNYQAKLLALFYEELLVPWFKKEGYLCKAQPSIYDKNGKRRRYDYWLEKDGKHYIVEAKCHLEPTERPLNGDILKKWKNESFREFLEKDFLKKYEFRAKGEPKRHPTGKILVWWDHDKSQLQSMKENYKIDEIFSIKGILNDLKKESNKEYRKVLGKYSKWANDLFEMLLATD